jgi:hypothetical protein
MLSIAIKEKLSNHRWKVDCQSRHMWRLIVQVFDLYIFFPVIGHNHCLSSTKIPSVKSICLSGMIDYFQQICQCFEGWRFTQINRDSGNPIMDLTSEDQFGPLCFITISIELQTWVLYVFTTADIASMWKPCGIRREQNHKLSCDISVDIHCISDYPGRSWPCHRSFASITMTLFRHVIKLSFCLDTKARETESTGQCRRYTLDIDRTLKDLTID